MFVRRPKEGERDKGHGCNRQFHESPRKQIYAMITVSRSPVFSQSPAQPPTIDDQHMAMHIVAGA